jgi:hypothetical protein
MSWTDAEKRAYTKGYSSGAKWPLHKPPLPPQPVAREMMLAMLQLRDAANGIAATFGNGDEVAEKLWAEIDRFDKAVEALGIWLREPADRIRSGDVVVTKNEAGQIVAVTRQDEDGRIIEVIAQVTHGVEGKSNG